VDADDDGTGEGRIGGKHAGRNLRGGSFEGLTLDGADFQGSDIRGADFRGASLVGVSFRDARLGVRPLVGWLLLLVAIVVCGAAGVATGLFAENVRQRLADPDWDDVANGASMVALVVIFVVTLVVKGISKALLVTGAALALAVVVNTVANLVWDDVDWSGGLRAIGLLLAFGLAVLAGVLGRAVGGTLGAWAIAIVAALGGLAAGRRSASTGSGPAAEQTAPTDRSCSRTPRPSVISCNTPPVRSCSTALTTPPSPTRCCDSPCTSNRSGRWTATAPWAETWPQGSGRPANTLTHEPARNRQLRCRSRCHSCSRLSPPLFRRWVTPLP
jgi:hypothetical protein